MKLERNQLLQKTKLSKAVGEIPSQKLREEAENRYVKLLAENDLSHPILGKHLRQSILPSVAIYEVLLSAGHSQERAFQVIRNSVLASAKPMAKMFQTVGRLPFFFALLRKMCLLSVRTEFGEPGWKMEWKRNDCNGIEWNCYACFYVDMMKHYGVPELISIFCERDDVVYGNIPGVIWGRTKTIGDGAELCDFRFYNQRGKWRDL